MKYDTIQQLRAFDDKIFDAVQEYLNNRDSFAADSVLAINAKTKEIIIDSPENVTKCDHFQLDTLIRADEQGNPEPDCDATNELASKYYFVR